MSINTTACVTMFGLGEPGNGMLLRAAHARHSRPGKRTTRGNVLDDVRI